MKGNPEVVKSLVDALSLEARHATVYHLDKRDLKYQGLDKLAHKLAGFGEDCERFAKEITDKIFFLEGSPVVDAGRISEAPSITVIFQRALDGERAIVLAFNDYYLQAQEARDADTRNQYEHWIKVHTHEHIAWLEEQLADIKTFGELEYQSIQKS